MGARIKAIRTRLGLTLEQVGEGCGMSKGTLSEIEHGTDVRVSTLGRIARALGVEVGELLGG